MDTRELPGDTVPYAGSWLLTSQLLTVLSAGLTAGFLGLTEIGPGQTGIHVMYTVFTAVHLVAAIWMVVVFGLIIFDKSLANDRVISLAVIVDLYFTYILAWTNVVFLFWLWADAPDRDNYIAGMTNSDPFIGWIRSSYITTLLIAGVGYGQYIPTNFGLELGISVYVVGNVIFFALILSAAVGIAVDVATSKDPRKEA